MTDKYQNKISIILPCLNEQESIEKCVLDIESELQKSSYDYEILVINNNSTDDTEVILKDLKIKIPRLNIFTENHRGYGNSCIRGLNESTGELILIMDSDQTYPSEKILDFIKELENGYDFVIGNRFKGKIKKGSMPKLHQYVGNPFLSFMVKFLFKTNIGDVHCGMRAIKKTVYRQINLYTSGMEFASEMVIKAVKKNLRIKEIPIDYNPRVGESKLKSFRDGWRHLRFILLYSPFTLFFLPGLSIFLIGFISIILFLFKNISIFGINFFVHPMFISSLLTIIGYQLIIFAGFAKAYALNHLNEENLYLEKILKYISMEKGIFFGLFLTITGFIFFLKILIYWLANNMPNINEIKISIFALTLIILGIQTIYSSFVLSIISIKEIKNE